jgi:EAL domain-containing protein (putative c-di-GMP-specific phosphodiesterase class I)
VRAVLGLGQGLGLPVLAEGVETASELQFLSHEAACTEVQGFLIRRPCDIAQLRDVTDGDVAPGDAMPGEPDIPQPQLMAG